MLNRATFSAEYFQDNHRIRFGMLPLDLRQTYYGCGDKLTVEHDLQWKRGGIVRHYDVDSEWATLCASALTPSAVSHKPLIKYGG